VPRSNADWTYKQVTTSMFVNYVGTKWATDQIDEENNKETAPAATWPCRRASAMVRRRGGPPT
jgi:hypothetical protein